MAAPSSAVFQVLLTQAGRDSHGCGSLKGAPDQTPAML
jgi:hypothetical protein